MTDPFNKVMFYGSVFVLNICLVVCVWLLGPFTIFKPQLPTVLAITPQVLGVHKAVKKDTIKAKSLQVILPSIGVNLSVEEGYHNLKTDQWTLADGKAFHAAPSAPINNLEGNSLIYGHDTESTFGKLVNLKAGDELLVHTEGGYIFHYSFVSSREVRPDDLSIFSYQGPPIVTLQTCSGSWSQHRQFFEFHLKSVDKP